MTDEHVISALVRKFSEIKGKLKESERNSSELRRSLVHIEAVLKLFRSDFQTARIIAKRPKQPIRWGKRGQGWYSALEILRYADSPMSAREIGIQVARKLGVETGGEPLRYLVTSLADSLQRGMRKGVVVQIGSYPRRWQINR